MAAAAGATAGVSQYAVSTMKTTIDIADALLAEARDTAAREGITLRALVEERLRDVLARRRKCRVRFALRDASFGGEGLQPGVDLTDWSAISNKVYGTRGR